MDSAPPSTIRPLPLPSNHALTPVISAWDLSPRSAVPVLPAGIGCFLAVVASVSPASTIQEPQPAKTAPRLSPVARLARVQRTVSPAFQDATQSDSARSTVTVPSTSSKTIPTTAHQATTSTTPSTPVLASPKPITIQPLSSASLAQRAVTSAPKMPASAWPVSIPTYWLIMFAYFFIQVTRC